jgi:hypothetical protein
MGGGAGVALTGPEDGEPPYGSVDPGAVLWQPSSRAAQATPDTQKAVDLSERWTFMCFTLSVLWRRSL